jgi:hypothetical protein
VGYQWLLVARDGAQTWKAFSPDLTTPRISRRLRATLPVATAAAPGARGGGGRGGGPAIADFVLSTTQKGVAWTVSSNGQIYYTIDAGVHWTNLGNIAAAPQNISFLSMDGAHHDTATT